jgi:hypothetical protein
VVCRWFFYCQSSVSPFTNWTDINTTATTYTPTNLNQTTKYRAVFSNSVFVVAIISQQVMQHYSSYSISCAGNQFNYCVGDTAAAITTAVTATGTLSYIVMLELFSIMTPTQLVLQYNILQ